MALSAGHGSFIICPMLSPVQVVRRRPKIIISAAYFANDLSARAEMPRARLPARRPGTRIQRHGLRRPLRSAAYFGAHPASRDGSGSQAQQIERRLRRGAVRQFMRDHHRAHAAGVALENLVRNAAGEYTHSPGVVASQVLEESAALGLTGTGSASRQSACVAKIEYLRAFLNT